MNSNRHGEWPLDQKVKKSIESNGCNSLMDIFSQIYIGDLGNDATRYELEDAFSPFGSVKNVWIAKRPPGGQRFLLSQLHALFQYLPGFAFILMDDPRDAEDAVKELDGTRMCGRRVKVIFLSILIVLNILSQEARET